MIYNGGIYNKQWNTKKLSDLGTFARGVSKHRPRNDKKLFYDGKYPLVQTSDIKNANLYVISHSQEYGDFGLRQSRIWNAGTLCITIAANIAETAILAYPMCFPDSVVGFTAFENESSELFMYYLFKYIRNSIQNSASGSIQDNINIEYLMNLDFKIPAKLCQDRIVRLLSAIDNKILLNNKINDNLDQQTQLLYDYWFAQFEFPDENGNPYRSSGKKMMWNEALKQEIPLGWNIVTVSELLNSIPVTTKIKTTDYLANGLLPIIDQSTTYIAGYTNITDAQLYNKNGFIVFGDHTRIVKYIRFPFARGADGTQVLSSNSNRMPNELFYQVINKIDLSNYGYARHFKFLKDSKVVLPDETTARQYANNVRLLYTKQVHLLFENNELNKLRDWLLPMLMNGQATIKD